MVSTLVRKIRTFAQRQPFLFMLILLTFGEFYGFAIIAVKVTEGKLRGIDRSILMLARDPQNPQLPYGSLWLQEGMRDLTALGGSFVLTIVGLAALGYLFIIGKRARALYTAMSIVGGFMICNLLKKSFDLPRPELFSHGSITHTTSFPSSHSMMAAIVYLTLGALLAETQPKVRLKLYIIGLAVLLTLLVGISRIYLAAHWPSDVLAGWLGGGAWALMMWLLPQGVLAWKRKWKSNTLSD